ncbi:MAG: Fibronectin, type domain protein [Acidimicrobiales bacterium]|nr:Fibronectin, type domain protein [Acidimicrobiales bacterium]
MRRLPRALAARLLGTRPAKLRAAFGGASLLGLVALGLFVHPWSTTSYDVSDSGIWITKTNQVGRVNGQIAEIDLAVKTGNADLLQDGRSVYTVLVADETTITKLDEADPTLDPITVDVSGKAQVAAGGGVVAALAEGEVTLFEQGSALEPSSVDLPKVGRGAQLAVGRSGTVATFDPRSGDLSVLPAGSTKARKIDLGPVSATFELSLVGDAPVVLDRDGARLLLEGHDPVDLSDRAGELALQWPGPAADAVVVGFDGGLMAIDRSGGSIEDLTDAGTGPAARPAVSGGCTFGAWLGSSPSAEVRCGSQKPMAPPNPLGPGTWEWRAGGPDVVLNQPASGAAYVVLDGSLTEVGPWPDESPATNPTEDVQRQPQKPDGTNVPVAVPDDKEASLGARPGRITYLNTLRNDLDKDGDVLFVTALRNHTGKGLAIAQGGRSVALDLSKWPKGKAHAPVTFEYQISDGTPGKPSNWAPVEVDIVIGAGNPPELAPNQQLGFAVTAGKKVDYEVLSAFWDPDGDPIYLDKVSPPPSKHQVSWEPSGSLAFQASQTPGPFNLSIWVKDGYGVPALPAAVQVSVGPAGVNAQPELRTDFVVARQGVATTVEPLANDSDADNDPLKVVAVSALREEVKGGLGKIENDGRLVTFTPTATGDYVILYEVRDTPGAATVPSTIAVRVTVSNPQAPPVALPDIVRVESGRSATVDLLGNDDDPNDRLLSVVSVTPPPNPNADTAKAVGTLGFGMLRDYRTFRVDALQSALPGGVVTFDYTVTNGSSNGFATATSTITVLVVPAEGNRAPRPVVPAMRVPVRAGDVARIPTALLATDPDGDPLSLKLIGRPKVGRATTGGDSLRYFAPADAGSQSVVLRVEVKEPFGTTQPTEVVMMVAGSEGNSAPRAEPLEARVRIGRKVVIPVPLDGLDDDGDAVHLQGRSDSNTLRGDLVADSSAQTFTYTATDDRFTDVEELTYQTVDARGLASKPAPLRIVVLPAATQNSPPTAMTDRVLVAAGGQVWVNPVTNDTDLDGEDLKLLAGSATVETGDCAVEEADGGLRIDAARTDFCSISYRVHDNGEPQRGLVEVEVLDSFAGLAPIARDDYPEVDREDTVKVPVLGNDEDPDGSPRDLEVTLVDGAAGVDIDTGTRELIVPVTDTARVVHYQITDRDGLTADAVVRVPARGANRPPYRAKVGDFELKADDPALEIDLATLIKDPDGDQITFSDASSAHADRDELNAGLVNGGTIARFQPTSLDYFGTSTLTVRATDDGNPRLKKVFNILVTITSRKNRPPTWTTMPCTTVSKGADQAYSVELSTAAHDPDLDDQRNLTFTGSDTKKGVELKVSKDGHMTISAGEDAVTDTSVTFPIIVADREGPIPPQDCTIRVTRYKGAPLAAAGSSETVDQSDLLDVDVTGLVSNAAKGKPILESAKLEPGSVGSVNETAKGFTYRSAKDFAGDVFVRYTVTDALSDVGNPRESSAVVSIRVRGRPDAPTVVTAMTDASATVDVRWVNGDFHYGEMLENGFHVTSDNGARKDCAASPCRLDASNGIRNGESYSFTVVAENEVGSSPESHATVAVTPDTPPGRPVSVEARVEPGMTPGAQGKVKITWLAGDNDGSEVFEYRVNGPDGPRTVKGQLNEALVDGTNGELLCATVQARNRNKSEDGYGPASEPACTTPYGMPSVTNIEVAATSLGNATVSWDTDGGGANLASWTVEPSEGAQGCASASGEFPADRTARTTIDVHRCAVGDVSFTITARSLGAGAPPGVGKRDATLYGRPVYTAKPKVTAGFGAITIAEPKGSDVNWNFGADRQFRYTVSPSGQTGTADRDDFPLTVKGLASWQPVTVSMVACNSADTCSDAEKSQASDAVTPYGAPDAGWLTVGAGTGRNPNWGDGSDTVQVNFTWAPPEYTTRRYTLEATASTGGRPVAPFELPANPSLFAIYVGHGAGQITWMLCDADDGTVPCTPGPAIAYEAYVAPADPPA